MPQEPVMDLLEIKREIGRFAVECARRQSGVAERELGELLLHLLRIAELQGIDLFVSAERAVSARASVADVVSRTGTAR